jgi:hypothetical protein
MKHSTDVREVRDVIHIKIRNYVTATISQFTRDARLCRAP